MAFASFIILAMPLLFAIASAQRRVNHTMYLLHCNATDLNWGGRDDYRDKLEVGIYLYGPQEYANQPPWHWGTAYALGRRQFHITWAKTEDHGLLRAEMNGNNEFVNAHINPDGDDLKVGEKAGTADWRDELYNCTKDDERLLYTWDGDEVGNIPQKTLYLCYTDYFCAFAGYNYTDGSP
jgi:hypothetical protein